MSYRLYTTIISQEDMSQEDIDLIEKLIQAEDIKLDVIKMDEYGKLYIEFSGDKYVKPVTKIIGKTFSDSMLDVSISYENSGFYSNNSYTIENGIIITEPEITEYSVYDYDD